MQTLPGLLYQFEKIMQHIDKTPPQPSPWQGEGAVRRVGYLSQTFFESVLFAFVLRDKLSGFTLIRLLAEVGKRGRGKVWYFLFPQ